MPTTDDIEITVCKDQASYDEDIAIEIYVATVTNLYRVLEINNELHKRFL